MIMLYVVTTFQVITFLEIFLGPSPRTIKHSELSNQLLPTPQQYADSILCYN